MLFDNIKKKLKTFLIVIVHSYIIFIFVALNFVCTLLMCVVGILQTYLSSFINLRVYENAI